MINPLPIGQLTSIGILGQKHIAHTRWSGPHEIFRLGMTSTAPVDVMWLNHQNKLLLDQGQPYLFYGERQQYALPDYVFVPPEQGIWHLVFANRNSGFVNVQFNVQVIPAY